MTYVFNYELWNGHKVLGYFSTTQLIYGKEVIVPELSGLKRPYNRGVKEIRVPILARTVSDDGIHTRIRRVLDVRKKSKRQIKLLSGKVF